MNTLIDTYRKKLDFPQWPAAVRAENTNVSSTKAFRWVKSVAKMKTLTGLDAFIGFDIRPDPKNRKRNHIYLGVPSEVELL